jgi:transcriptional regulator with GAF, ATPase, and Fis domain
VPVLILGETGTGKELLARRIHASSGRGGPFVVGNCANLRGELAEVMLHGQQVHHNDPRARGYPKPGWFELAERGTLFLDEIGDLPLDAQASLLRVLQERQVRRLLADDWISVDFRLVAATNRDLESDMADHLFRRDLYFRLSAFPIRVPALRERRDDIPKLLEYFRIRYTLAFSRDVVFAPDVVEFFVRREYPGNIRELENLVQRVVALAPSARPTVDEVTAVDFPLMSAPSSSDAPTESVTSQRQYAQLLTDWIEKHIDELGTSPDYRSRTAFIRAAITHVCSSHVVPGDYPKSEQYILKELIRGHRPDIFRRIVDAGARMRGVGRRGGGQS